MKITVQVLLHAFCAFAGFWIAAPVDEEEPDTVRTSANPAHARTRPAAPPISRPRTASEAGVARLTPLNWAEAIHPISHLRLDELPAMLRGLRSNPFPEVKWRLLHCLFERWAELDRAGALAALRSFSCPQHKEYALRAVLTSWTKTDTAAAWKWVTALDDDSVLQEAGIKTMLALTAAKDPLASAAWADQIEDVFLREKALTQIGDTWMSEDAPAALTLLITVEPERLRTYMLSKLCYRDGVDHAAGLEIVAQLPSQAARSTLSADWLGAFADEKPQEAFQWLLSHADRPELQRSSGTLGGILAVKTQNFADLRAMALQLPAGPVRDAFAARAADEWASAGHSIPEAKELLALCGPCLERDSAQSMIESKR